MNRGELVSECALSMGLDTTVGSNELKLQQRWVNRGIVDILKKTRCYTDLGTMTLQAGITDYRIDPNILQVDNITLVDTTGAPFELDVIAMADLLPYLNPSIATTTMPTYAAIEGTLLRVAPVPSSAVVLTYIYVPKPTEIPADGTTGSDSLDPSTATYGGIPLENHDVIVAYMLWQAARYDQQGGGFFRGHAFAPGSAFRADYDQLIKEMKHAYRHKAGRGLNPAQVGYPDRKGISTRNDTYPQQAR